MNVQAEVDRIQAKILEFLERPSHPARQMDELRAAQQALAWSQDPGGFKSPYDMIMAQHQDLAETVRAD